MATTHAYKRKEQHRGRKKSHSKKRDTRKSTFGEIEKTKEYTILWLYDNAISQQDDYDISKVKLRGIVDYLRKISYIDDIRKTKDQNIMLVLSSGTLEKHFVQLTNSVQIRLIYVYQERDDNNSQSNRNELFIECPKVRGPFEDLKELFFTLSKHIRTMTFQPSMATEPPPLTSASKTIERSTSTSYSYVTDWYIHLIRAFQTVPPTRSCKDKFVEECALLYHDNPSILQAIEEFKITYTPDEAIRWYTRDGFLYKVLNRILREKNQQAIQLTHFLIYDLDHQLSNELRTIEQDWMRAETVHLYRGQLMSMEELQQLKKNKGEELFVNSFLSMTTDLAVANMFAGAGAFGPDDPIQSVIFDIEWADFSPKHGLADIHRLSYNGDEGEILLSPTYTVNLLDCVYDEKERVWNAIFTRIPQVDDPLIRISDDERLMRLELTLQHLIEEKDSSDDDDDDTEEMLDPFSDSQDDKFEFTRKFCSAFVEDVPILQRELNLPELCSVTLNDDSSGRFQLKTFRSFTADLFDHGPKILDDMIVTLYDALGGVFKTKGKLMQAYFYYQKASIYDKPQSQTTYTRQSHLAQIHKLNSDYELAWNIFDELMDRTEDVDSFLYEDIALARSDTMTDEAFLQNSYAFLQYCSTYNDDGGDGDEEEELFIDNRVSYVIDAWAELGYRYFYQNHDTKHALDCYMHEQKLSVTNSRSKSPYFNSLIGSCSERMGDVYASENDVEKALKLYQEALDLALQEKFAINWITAARCMCKIGRYRPSHEYEIFYRAFQYLLYGYGKPYIRDTIGKCYMCLSQSLQRYERYQEALKYVKQAISIFLPDPLLLEPLIEKCCQLVIELYRSANNDNTSPPTKEDVLKDRVLLDDEQIKNMLQMTMDELESESKHQ
ncbi:hypothetical protein I4U23_016321 [Adineta vaga]|nr:hypothetical protein I4U23_016321 [Adineta vaga]